jgi:hypothetical protein
MPAERAGSSPGGQGKAVPVEETAVPSGRLGRPSALSPGGLAYLLKPGFAGLIPPTNQARLGTRTPNLFITSEVLCQLS